VRGDPGSEGLRALLGQEQQDPVAAQLVVLDHRADPAAQVSGRHPPLVLDGGRGLLEGSLDQALTAAEVAQDGLDAHAGALRDVGEGDVRGESLGVQCDGGLQHRLPRLLHGLGAGRHPIGARP